MAEKYYIRNDIIKLPDNTWEEESFDERVARVTVELRAKYRRLKRRGRRKERREKEDALSHTPNYIDIMNANEIDEYQKEINELKKRLRKYEEVE